MTTDTEIGLRVEIARLVKCIEQEKEELNEGDFWMKRSIQFHESGGCPVCFATDEAGHNTGCPWGHDEGEVKRLCGYAADLRRHCRVAIEGGKILPPGLVAIVGNMNAEPGA